MVFRLGLLLVLLVCLVHMASAKIAEDDYCGVEDHPYNNLPKNVSMGCKSVDWRRYKFIHEYYAVLRFLVNCYYMLVDAIFELINWFEPMQTVGWQNASQLLFIPAHQAAAMIREGNLTSVELITAYVDRLKEVNPMINAIAHKNYGHSLKLAREVDTELARMDDSERKKLAFSKPLYGVPFTTKNNLNVKGFVTGAGSKYLLKGSPPATETAPIVKRMMDAGAILIAISTLPNMAMSYAGDDSAYGVTNNPHDTRRITGGSSAGEGALIGAGASLCGIGNDIGGSVRIPAAMNGIFALKPTTVPDHVVPNEGILPKSLFYKPALNMLSNGPMCRYASDLPLALAVMAGKKVDAFQQDVDFSKVKVFYMDDLNVLLAQELQPAQQIPVKMVKSYFEFKHNVTVQRVEFPLMSRLLELFYADPWSEGIPSYEELKQTYYDIQAGVANATHLGLQIELLKRFLAPKSENERELVLLKKEKLRKQVANLLGKNGLLVSPVWPTTVPFHHQEPFAVFNIKYTMIANVLGFPALAAPMYKNRQTNMPEGVQLMAAPFNEALLIAAAQELERTFGGWVKPSPANIFSEPPPKVPTK
ncbi:hypothetical protein niasHT_008522 [Heterodera trifolii]|uniref:Amidase domain-containing protein n=1 Tax=Heterodera trifolii TaxID=157864 RepID=A0ABD2MDN2_9BILA